MDGGGFYQLAAAEGEQRGLDGALGEAGFVGDHAEAGGDRFPTGAHGPAVEVQVDQEGGGLLVVADEVAEEDVNHVVVDGDGDP
jgi:hypothetical protein